MIPLSQIISNGLGFLKELMGFKREQANRENTPEMQANAKSEQDAKTADAARKTVANGSTDDIRQGLS